MSVIIAVKKDDIIYLGADTQCTSPTRKFHVKTGPNSKLIVLENGVIIGLAGMCVPGQILASHPEWFNFKSEDEFTKEYLTTFVIPKIKEAFKNYNYDENDFEFTIAYKSKAFEINRRFVVFCIEHKNVIGCGGDVIIYKLSKINIDGDINEQLLDALRFSEKNDSAVGAPFILVNTKDLKIEIREE